MAEDLRAVFCCDDKNDTKLTEISRWKSFCLKWEDLYPVFERKAKNERYEHYFTYLNYDYRIRNLIYSTNWIERLHRDYKRTTKMRGALPTVEATLLLSGNFAMNRKYYQYKITALKYENKQFRWDE